LRLSTIDIIILLSLGIFLIARSVWGFSKDIGNELSKSKSISGKVYQAQIRKIQEATFKVTKYKTVFAFQLDNSSEKFAVDRGITVCNRLKSRIKDGDSIKIYYRSSTGEINTHIFQIEKDNFVIINYKDYSNKEFSMMVFMAMFGALITIGTVVWAVKQDET